MTLAELFTNNYKYLNLVAKRITKRRDIKMAPDLLSETYLNLQEKETECPQNNDEFIKFFSKCMKNYFVWPNSSFNTLYKLDVNEKERITLYRKEWDYEKYNHAPYGLKTEDHFRGEVDTNPTGIDGVIDEDALHNIEIQVEGTNDFTKELIEISSSLGRMKTLKYIELLEFKRTLPDYEIILFELYFEKELSTRDIAKHYSEGENHMNYQTINKMINTIKTKINNYTWKS